MPLLRSALTLAILKPSTVARPLIVEHINNLLRKEGIQIVKSETMTLSRKKACEFYKEHEGRFFYDRLVTYMSSGPIEVKILSGMDIIQHWRKLLGPTKVYKAQFEAADSIRGQYGLSDTRNAAHGSDSPETAAKEIGFFFPKFNINEWYRNNGESLTSHSKN